MLEMQRLILEKMKKEIKSKDTKNKQLEATQVILKEISVYFDGCFGQKYFDSKTQPQQTKKKKLLIADFKIPKELKIKY